MRFFRVLLCAGVLFQASAGVATDMTFAGGAPGATLSAQDSLSLKVAFWQWTKIMQDTRLKSASTITRSPEVLSTATDSFTFLWAENFGHDTDKVFRQTMKLGRNTSTAGPITAIMSRADSAIRYLHADQGQGKFVCSFVDRNRTGRLYAVDGTDTLRVDPSVTTPFSSLCHFDKDTFLIIYRNANTRLLIAKVQVGAPRLAVRAVDTVARGGSADSIISNSSIAADSNGNILAIWTRGQVNGPKRLEYKVMDRSFARIAADSGMLDDSVCSSKTLFYIDDAQTVSYAPGKFAVVTWDTAGIMMHRININAGITLSSQRLASDISCRFPSITRNDTLLVVGWRGRMLDPVKTGIECVRFSIAAGVLSAMPRDSFRISADTTAVGQPQILQSGGELHMALDRGGSMGVGWMSPSLVYGAIMANRPVTFDNGDWTSPVILTGVPAGDSIAFYPDSIEWTGGMRDTLIDRIRFVLQSNDTTIWMNARDSMMLAAQGRGPIKAFQRSVHLARDSGNVLSYPKVSSISARWNAKPRGVLDSITVNGVRKSLNGFTLFPRFDTVRCYVRSRDADADNRLTLTTTLVSTQVLPLAGATEYQRVIRFEPLAVTNTTVPLGVKVRDERGWGDSLTPIPLTVRNSAPQIQTTVILDTAAANRKDTVGLTGAMNNFSIQQGDSLYFRYAVSDSNDPAICVRIKLINGRDTLIVDSACGPEVRVFAVGSDIIADGQTRILRFEATDPDTTVWRHVIIGVNHLPVISLVTGGIQNAPVADNAPLWMHVNRTARFIVSVTDPDVTVWDSITYIIKGSSFEDSVKRGAAVCTVSCRAVPADTVIRIIAHDLFNKADTITFFPLNHLPSLTRVVVGGRDTIGEGDSARMILGDTVPIYIAIGDSDVAHWDSITYRVSSITQDFSAVAMDSQTVIRVVVGISDTIIRIVIRDSYGRTDSIRFIPRHPWFPRDSAGNPAYGIAKDSLRRMLALIGGSGARDTVVVPVWNSGNDTMSVTRIQFKGKIGVNWMAVRYWNDTGYSVVSLLPASAAFIPIRLAPGGSTMLQVYVNADRLTGDGLVYDTIFVFTSDPLNRVDTIPVRLEYNDLPRMSSVGFSFNQNRPYYLPKKSAAVVYTRPPYSKIVITFSEPMDTATADSAVHAYSVFDSIARGSVSPILFKRTWNAAQTVLSLAPIYTQPSTVLAGIRPDTGFFIPTDSIRFIVNNRFTDKATTPSAPNRLDIHRNYTRVLLADTSFGFRIDSVSFKVIDARPDSAMTDVSGKAPIEVFFSSAPYPGTIDTARTNNRSLSVSSRFLRGTSVVFDSVRVNGNIARFYPAIRFFSGDSVYCHYHSVTGRDSAGYPADIARTGMPVSLFNDTAAAGDLWWHYRVKPIRITAVTPAAALSGQSVTSAIRMTFSDPVPRSVFDTDTGTGNRSFRIVSSFGGGKAVPFKRISFNRDSTTITILPKYTFYSYDSIVCRFLGFSSAYSYDSLVNYPRDTVNVFGDTTWYFLTENSGCYTFPNPYKPSLDNRHCGTPNAPCGIWFKNLHALKRGVTDVRISVMNVNGYPVFDTRKAGIVIHFETDVKLEEPAWKWDTKNQAGALVASGYYYYAIYDMQGSVLSKGKLMIIR